MKQKKFLFVFLIVAVWIVLLPTDVLAAIPYDYTCSRGEEVTYTYFTTFNLSANETVTFSTAKVDGGDSIDTVLYLFSINDPSTYTWVNDDYGSSIYSRISVTITNGGPYGLLVVSGGINETGYCKLLKNGSVYHSYIPVAGSYIDCGTTSNTGYLNYFTSNLSYNCDTRLFLLSPYGTICAYNDNYSGSGNFNWGSASRIRKNVSGSVVPASVILTASSASTEGSADVYMHCADGYDSTIAAAFPNILANDTMKSAGATVDYNCHAWAGGLTDRFLDIYVNDSASNPWYDVDATIAWNNYYGNNPLRYNGATTYTCTTNSNQASVAVFGVYNSKVGGYIWTHSAIRNTSDGRPHGFDWESKLGKSVRIFHTLSGISGGIYGYPTRYYKKVANGSRELTLDESLNEGLTVYRIEKLNKNQEDFLSKKVNTLTKQGVTSEADRLFEAWVSECTNDSKLQFANFASEYAAAKQYQPLMDYLLKNDPEGYWIINCFVQELQNEESNLGFSILLVSKFLLEESAEKDLNIALANEIREINNQMSVNSEKEGNAYIAPSQVTNTMDLVCKYINRRLN